jgi:hypothetical protein
MPIKGEEVYLYSFFNLGAIRGWVVNATLLQLNHGERDPVPISPNRDSILGLSSP